MATSDRRFIQRFPVDFRVDFMHAGNYMISCGRNISMDGMFINTDSPAPVGTHVNIIFPVAEKHDVEVAALVVWNRGKDSFHNSGMGIQFLSPLPQTVKQSCLKGVDRIFFLDDNGLTA